MAWGIQVSNHCLNVDLVDTVRNPGLHIAGNIALRCLKEAISLTVIPGNNFRGTPAIANLSAAPKKSTISITNEAELVDCLIEAAKEVRSTNPVEEVIV